MTSFSSSQNSLRIVRLFVLSRTRTIWIKNKGLRKRGLLKVRILSIGRPDLHFSSLNVGNDIPHHSSIVCSVPIDTIQAAISTVIVPPGSLYFHLCCAINSRCVIILIFCREFTAIMIS